MGGLLRHWYLTGILIRMQTNLLEEYQRLQTGESTRAVAYLRLRRALQNLMDAGVLRPGQALPSERDLAQLLDLSRVTIRKALAGLIESGLLVQRQGAGTFVAERILRQFSRLTSFTDDLRERGLNPQVKFLERSDLLAQFLAIANDIFGRHLAVEGSFFAFLLFDQPRYAIERDAPIISDDPAAAVGVGQTCQDVRTATRPDIGSVGIEHSIVMSFPILAKRVYH